MAESHDRTFAGPVELDGHELVGKVVPWGEPARIVEQDPESGRMVEFMEQFERGSFDDQIRSGNIGTIRKIALRDEHDDGIGKVGWAREFEDRDDGLWARFRVRDASISDVAAMVDDGIDGLSVRFLELGRGGTRAMGPVPHPLADRRPLRLLSRIRAYMVHVALVATPAYASARVASVRESPEELLAEQAATQAREAFIDDLDAFLSKSKADAERWQPRA